ncbi:MAG: hypothetical protein HY816_16385 [Candidatus Wallbacteria bacterium]|nr:hypothetical protein [Candidatus Wallbacteria bacterium]
MLGLEGRMSWAAWVAVAGCALVSELAAHPPPAVAANGAALELAGEPAVVLRGVPCTAALAAGSALWIGTSGRGITRFEAGRSRTWAAGEGGLPRGRVNAFAWDGRESVWALIDPDRIVRWTGEDWDTVAAPPGFTRALAWFRGKLVAGSSQGLFLLEDGGWRVTRVAGAVEALAADGERECWAARGDGRLLGLSGGGEGEHRLERAGADDTVRALAVADGWLVAGRFGGLSELPPAGEAEQRAVEPGRRSPPPVARPKVTSLAVVGGMLLCGTWGDGMLARMGGGWYSLTRAGGLPSERVEAVAAGSDWFAVATDGGTFVAPLAAGAPLPVTSAASAAAAQESPASPLALELEPEKLGLRLSRPDPLPRQILRSQALGGETSPLARLGDILFEDPTVLGPRAQSLSVSCGTCHPAGDTNPGFFIPGLSRRPGTVDLTHRYFNAAAHNDLSDPVDIPSLRGVRLTGPYGRDGRTGSLREFIRNVIVLEFGGPEPSTRDLDALTAYTNEFEFLPNSLLGRSGQLVARAPLPAMRGEQLFQQPRPSFGGKSCASCHDPAAQFTDRAGHDVGTGGVFDTPALLGARRTAPYFHDGSAAGLAEVVAHFDKFYALSLTDDQKRDLVAYLEVVGDVDEPWQRAEKPVEPGPLPAGTGPQGRSHP